MISSRHNQGHIGQLSRHNFERLDHQFESLVGSPFSEGENAVVGIAAPRKIWILGTLRKNSMGAHVHILPAIFLSQNLPVSRHQDRNRVRQEKNFGGHDARRLIRAGMTNPGIFQVDGVHQVMQRDVCITSAQAREHRSEKSHKRNQRITPERAEKQVEPDDVGFQPSHGRQ
jgi:hypothetical protein